ncbi:MAG: hypothetical protein IVW55_05245 [Chloroflexi bacterium]|nr:hypothetical protein [Chloroflexota bacterium]
MWQFIQDYWTWGALALFYFFMMKMHMGGGHSMHDSSKPQGASTQASGGHQHGAQPEQPATGQKYQSTGNLSNTSNVANGTDSVESSGEMKQSHSGRGGCH